MSAIPVWLLAVLGVIAGVPLYALIAGWTERYITSQPESAWLPTAGKFWPLVFAWSLVETFWRALFVLPARAAYRAARGDSRQ